MSCGQQPIRKLLHTLESWNFRAYRSPSPKKIRKTHDYKRKQTQLPISLKTIETTHRKCFTQALRHTMR